MSSESLGLEEARNPVLVDRQPELLEQIAQHKPALPRAFRGCQGRPANGRPVNQFGHGFANQAGKRRLCIAATSLATVYDDVFGWQAPYAWYSPVVLLGTVGGIGLLVGPAGLVGLKFKADREPSATQHYGMDMALPASLFLVSLTGLALLAFRETSAMGILLTIHLGFVMWLFLVLPYGKFDPGLYLTAALVRNAAQQDAGVIAPTVVQTDLRT